MNCFEGYRITSPYGYRIDPFGQRGTEFHRGIDLVKAHRSPILAFVPGEVLHAQEGRTGTGFGNYGNVVAIRDKDGSLHCYCHLDSVSVKVGQTVVRGQEVGKQGNTGRSTGSHLHYEVRAKCTPSYGFQTDVDPAEYLTKYLAKETVTVPKMDKDAAEKVIAVLGALYMATDNAKVREAAHCAANALRDAAGIPRQ